MAHLSAVPDRYRRTAQADYEESLSFEAADYGWVGSSVEVSAELELVENGHIVLELTSTGAAESVELGGVTLDAAGIQARSSVSLSPEEARVLAAALDRYASKLEVYRAECAAEALGPDPTRLSRGSARCRRIFESGPTPQAGPL